LCLMDLSGPKSSLRNQDVVHSPVGGGIPRNIAWILFRTRHESFASGATLYPVAWTAGPSATSDPRLSGPLLKEDRLAVFVIISIFLWKFGFEFINVILTDLRSHPPIPVIWSRCGSVTDGGCFVT
jgi:hypothetical protein